MKRPDFSILDGPYADEWLPYGLGDVRVASRSATGAARPAAAEQLHLCRCGCKQELATCGHWVCRAPGHSKHVCGGVP